MPLPFQIAKHTFNEPGLLDVLPIATDFFNATTPVPLTELPEFYGSGVYGLYYVGDYRPYAPLAKRNKEKGINTPIYIGMTKPAGGRTGIIRADSKAKPLFNRINQHRNSIIHAHDYAVENRVDAYIRAEDFYCRFMVIPDEFWPLTGAFETGLIRQHLPIWNSAMPGFGIHDPGAGRGLGRVSYWDSLHPGRKHSNKDAARYTHEAIFAKVQKHLEKQNIVELGLFKK